MEELNKTDLKDMWPICGGLDGEQSRLNVVFSKILGQCYEFKFCNGSRDGLARQSQSHVV